jgi:hypothetical protein
MVARQTSGAGVRKPPREETWLIVETVHSSRGKPVAPGAGRTRADLKASTRSLVLQTASRRQDNARPLGQRSSFVESTV